MPFASITKLPPARWKSRTYESIRPAVVGPLTLEVLDGNRAALAVYADVGFHAYALDPAMGRAVFLEKKLF